MVTKLGSTKVREQLARESRASAAMALLAWYDRHRRVLPWRAPPGDRSDPYAVWLSEIMLQQTTVAAVGPYFRDFLNRWPTVTDLAAAPLDDLLHAWQGLGYYARARNMHKCATVIAGDLGGVFPDTEEGLRKLPGIGPYTAAAIAAIAFGRPAVVVDGNVERVMARYFAVDTPVPTAKSELQELAARLTPVARPGDYAQAVMDLGATVCTPRRPKCLLCPLSDDCAAHAAGIAETLPRREAKKPKPTRHGIAFWIERVDGTVLLRRREEKGLLGGMMEFPSSTWGSKKPALVDVLPEVPEGIAPDAAWQMLDGIVRHTFTHFHLELVVVRVRQVDSAEIEGVWLPPDRFSEAALPSLMKKVARHALLTAAPGPQLA